MIISRMTQDYLEVLFFLPRSLTLVSTHTDADFLSKMCKVALLSLYNKSYFVRAHTLFLMALLVVNKEMLFIST